MEWVSDEGGYVGVDESVEVGGVHSLRWNSEGDSEGDIWAVRVVVWIVE